MERITGYYKKDKSEITNSYNELVRFGLVGYVTRGIEDVCNQEGVRRYNDGNSIWIQLSEDDRRYYTGLCHNFAMYLYSGDQVNTILAGRIATEYTVKKIYSDFGLDEPVFETTLPLCHPEL